MIHLPSEIRGNITMINGVPFGWGRVKVYSYECSEDREKEYHFKGANEFFRKVLHPGANGYLWLTQQERDWEETLNTLVERAPKRHRADLAKLNTAWLEQIHMEGSNSEYEFLFAVELGAPQQSLLSSLTRWLPLDKDFLDRLAGKNPQPVLNDDRVFKRLQRMFANQVSGKMKVEALKAEEIAEFYRDHSYQGAKMPHLDKALTRLFPWEKQDKTFLLPNPIQDEGSHVRIETPEGPKYVSYLPVAVFPGQIQAPGVDLFHRLPYMGLNVQAMIHWKHKGYREAKTWAFWKKKASKENLKHVGEVEDPSLADEDSEIQAELMEKEIANTKSPLNQIHVVFQVTADTPEDLKEQCRLLKEDLDGEGFVVHTPTADQAEFYDAWLPNSHWSPVGYSHPVLPDRTAALVMPGAHDKLGDPVGPPRGFLRNGSIFRFSLSWGARADVSSHLCIAGRTRVRENDIN